MANLKACSQEQELADILDEIKNYNLKDIDFKDTAPGSEELSQPEFLRILKEIQKNKKDHAVIDVRSEKEFEKNAIPFAINIPILNNIERHKVGLIYTKHSKDTGLSLAYYFAREKEQAYIWEALKHSQGKKIIVYCWRGGDRSKYVANLLQKNNIAAAKLQDGQKGFRRIVHDLLYNRSIPIISLSGLTGCGKSEILDYMKKFYPDFPVLHLENCAGHASSVFGEIRYNLRGETTKNQQQFEANIFMELLPHIDKDNNLPVFLSENESKKIGGLILPPAVQRGLEKEKHICLNISMERRIERLARDYFAFNSSNTNIKNKVKEKIKEQMQFLSKKLSRDKIAQYKEWIDKDQYFDFLKDIMESYYDKIYKEPASEPLLVIENRTAASTVDKILRFWQEKY